MKKKYSAFDYPFIIRRRNRYLVIESADFGFQSVLIDLMDQSLSTEAIGVSILKAIASISGRLQGLDRAGQPHPPPQKLALHGRSVVSIKEASRIIGSSQVTLRRLVHLGAINAERTAGGHLRFSLESISDYLASSQVQLNPKAKEAIS